jgi:hypothetical protein
MRRFIVVPGRYLDEAEIDGSTARHGAQIWAIGATWGLRAVCTALSHALDAYAEHARSVQPRSVIPMANPFGDPGAGSQSPSTFECRVEWEDATHARVAVRDTTFGALLNVEATLEIDPRYPMTVLQLVALAHVPLRDELHEASRPTTDVS